MKLRIEVQTHDYPPKRTVIADDRIRFVSTEDDRVAFDVVAKPDGSIEVRGVNTCVIGGVMTGERLHIEPTVSNSVTIRRRAWGI